MAGTGEINITSKGTIIGNVPPLSEYLTLDPVVMADLKYICSSELKKVLGISAGICSEENSMGPQPLVAFDELKRYKDSVTDSNTKARFRAKKLEENLHNLNKYIEVVNSKKQAKISSSSALNLEDQAENTAINKRARTSIADTRAEHQKNEVARQSLIIENDCDLQNNNSPSSDLVEVKIKRKRSMGTSLTRPLDTEF